MYTKVKGLPSSDCRRIASSSRAAFIRVDMNAHTLPLTPRTATAVQSKSRCFAQPSPDSAIAGALKDCQGEFGRPLQPFARQKTRFECRFTTSLAGVRALFWAKAAGARRRNKACNAEGCHPPAIADGPAVVSRRQRS